MHDASLDYPGLHACDPDVVPLGYPAYGEVLRPGQNVLPA